MKFLILQGLNIVKIPFGCNSNMHILGISDYFTEESLHVICIFSEGRQWFHHATDCSKFSFCSVVRVLFHQSYDQSWHIELKSKQCQIYNMLQYLMVPHHTIKDIEEISGHMVQTVRCCRRETYIVTVLVRKTTISTFWLTRKISLCQQCFWLPVHDFDLLYKLIVYSVAHLLLWSQDQTQCIMLRATSYGLQQWSFTIGQVQKKWPQTVYST